MPQINLRQHPVEIESVKGCSGQESAKYFHNADYNFQQPRFPSYPQLRDVACLPISGAAKP